MTFFKAFLMVASCYSLYTPAYCMFNNDETQPESPRVLHLTTAHGNQYSLDRDRNLSSYKTHHDDTPYGGGFLGTRIEAERRPLGHHYEYACSTEEEYAGQGPVTKYWYCAKTYEDACAFIDCIHQDEKSPTELPGITFLGTSCPYEGEGRPGTPAEIVEEENAAEDNNPAEIDDQLDNN